MTLARKVVLGGLAGLELLAACAVQRAILPDKTLCIGQEGRVIASLPMVDAVDVFVEYPDGHREFLQQTYSEKVPLDLEIDVGVVFPGRYGIRVWAFPDGREKGAISAQRLYESVYCDGSAQPTAQ